MEKTRRVFLLFLVSCLVSCSTSSAVYREIDSGFNEGDFYGALRSMENSRTRRHAYTSKNQILYYLDRGMIEHYAGLWADSSENLQQAERLIETAFTKSISEEIGSYLLNDNVKEYPGEDYEDLYINVFNALNYYHMGDTGGAMVEIRRVNEKLNFLSDKYVTAGRRVMSSNNGLTDEMYADEAVRFSSSALARYLSMLFNRSNGYHDNARIDLQELYRAYELAPDVYNHFPPSRLQDELNIPAGTARLNIIGFIGLSPIKEEVNIPVPLPLPHPNDWARLALPRMIDRPSSIEYIEIILNTGQRFRLELLENINRVARETFKARYGLILLKTAARSITKSVASAGIGRAVGREDRGLGALISVIGQVASVLSENADLRISRYFPGYAHVGGINLQPGVYSVTVNFYGRRGIIATEQRRNVFVRENTLNLLEFVCPR